MGERNSGSCQTPKEPITGLTRYVRLETWRLCSGLLRTGAILAVTLFAFSNAWALHATPTTLSFQAVQGGTSPSSQILHILKHKNHTVNWSSSDTATWLNVSPTMGGITSSAQISVSVNPVGFAQECRLI
jgi:hypothetical protein